MKFFDAHAHIGHDVVFDVDVTEKILLDTYEKYGIDGALVQPFIPRPYISDTREIHDRIYKMTLDHPGRFYGMISICPHLYPHEVEDECVRCVRELGFKGIKIATTAHGVSPSSKDGLHIFEIADQLNIPVMIHTGGGSFGAPLAIEKPVQMFPHVKVVIAHGGGEDGIDETVRLAKTYDNVFVEPSWVNLLSMEKFAKAVGADKLMFSSDMPQNVPAELAVFNAVFTSETDREKVFAGTALNVFKINE